MIPDTLGALLAFLGLVAPGLAFELLREKRRPSIEQTAFREASRIALTSLIFTVTAVTLLALVRAANPSWILDPRQWLREGDRYLQEHLTLVAGSLLVELVTAIGLAAAVDRVLRLLAAGGDIVPGSIWFQLFRERRPPGTTPWLHIKLKDETEIWGYLGDYTADQELANRELSVFGPKLEYRRKGGSIEPLESWSGISLRGDAMEWMKVAYVADDSPPEGPRLVPAVRRPAHPSLRRLGRRRG